MYNNLLSCYLPQGLPREVSTLPKYTILTLRVGPGSQYEYIDGVELLERYLPGGYHPISVGDLLNNRYRVVPKLGHGTFSTIWLSCDEQQAAYVAVKVSAADSTPRDADVLRTIAASSSYLDHPGRTMIPTVKDQFELQGPNGCHRCYVMTPARCSLSEATLFRLFTIETARSLVAQLVLAVAYTHNQGFVHGSIHLGNALLRLPSSLNQLSVEQLYEKFGTPYVEPIVRHDKDPLPAGVPPHATLPVWLGKWANEIRPTEARLILGDFGEAFFLPLEACQQRLGEQCRSPTAFLPPEAHFEPEKTISFPSDIWTLACAIWSILGFSDLFESMLATSDDISKQQIDILGELPHEWRTAWRLVLDVLTK
ncbi:CMGC/SRPK protein kinase [Nannizzia gypsea CBS 118893]|uniref:non-specific serine/threonine protein kinase n=1 Tax=Arthroderma gypseum (strain ATCC MYA-4604 / CBS 118893) TaxID=535722 RepID=E4V2K0_ARTGP|nr:CMGC/SRPK protein kinase [Nannizzia gypsea CBS 118893]EFR04265.1 CMGC/SRPK protein kinase [Nannizzia gypsea CBS 118893]